MSDKVVQIGSDVEVQVFLLCRSKKDAGNGKYEIVNDYRRHPEKGDQTQIYKIRYHFGVDPFEISPLSFTGRALLDRSVGDEVEVNVGGLSRNESGVGGVSGNHLKFKIVAIR